MIISYPLVVFWFLMEPLQRSTRCLHAPLALAERGDAAEHGVRAAATPASRDTADYMYIYYP